MRQYKEVKQRYSDYILFFRVGDFYEMFYEDAVTASKILEITLTSRDKQKEDRIPLCGIPYHASSSYIAKLIKVGKKVAICEQVEDPKSAKGIVRREVVRVVTPGTVVDSELLDARSNNYMAAVFIFPDKGAGLSFIDISTGEFRTMEILSDNFNDILLNELSRIEPKEIIFPQEDCQNNKDIIIRDMKDVKPIINHVSDESFSFDTAYNSLIEHFGVISLDGFGCQDKQLAVSAAGALLQYIKETQLNSLSNINSLKLHSFEKYMVIDSITQKNLELVRRVGDSKEEGTLFNILDRTITSMGSRMLKDWILRPLLDVKEIRQRQETIALFFEDISLRYRLRSSIKGVYDMERLIGRIGLGAASPRDIAALKKSLSALPGIRKEINSCSSEIIDGIKKRWDMLKDISELIDISIKDDPAPTLKDGGIIKDGYDDALDEVRSISRDGKGWMTRIEAKEKERTKIDSLKIKYNQVFGYYIEVTKANLSLVPDDYIRKQTLVNAERFITPELKEVELQVLTAEERIKRLECQLFEEIREKIANESKRIQSMAQMISLLDVLSTLAETAGKYDYTKPEIKEEPVIDIVDGRHPVLEQIILSDRFIPNDTFLNDEDDRLLIITGPNMAGKSTYMRQAALITLMSQMGSFVPAKDARIGIVDRIFTRVGAQDNLVSGQSTFMVEMNETANILNNSTKRSLILLDEIGRGTSTFDGVSIAWAVAEYIHNKQKIGARTLFATHYHELTEMVLTCEGVKNYNISVKEWSDRIIFLRKIVKGGTDRSYGIQVAKLAGLPDEVIERAKEILTNLESGELDTIGEPKLAHSDKQNGRKEIQYNLFSSHSNIIEEIEKDILSCDIVNMTPMEALNKLHELRNRIENRR